MLIVTNASSSLSYLTFLKLCLCLWWFDVGSPTYFQICTYSVAMFYESPPWISSVFKSNNVVFCLSYVFMEQIPTRFTFVAIVLNYIYEYQFSFRQLYVAYSLPQNSSSRLIDDGLPSFAAFCRAELKRFLTHVRWWSAAVYCRGCWNRHEFISCPEFPFQVQSLSSMCNYYNVLCQQLYANIYDSWKCCDPIGTSIFVAVCRRMQLYAIM